MIHELRQRGLGDAQEIKQPSDVDWLAKWKQILFESNREINRFDGNSCCAATAAGGRCQASSRWLPRSIYPVWRSAVNCARHRPVRLSWAKLLKHVFEIDMEHCPNCGSELKIIAAILEQPVIEKILTHLGLQARAPPRAPARGQTQVLQAP